MTTELHDYLATEWADLASQLERIADLYERYAAGMRRRAEHAREQARLAEADR